MGRDPRCIEEVVVVRVPDDDGLGHVCASWKEGVDEPGLGAELMPQEDLGRRRVAVDGCEQRDIRPARDQVAARAEILNIHSRRRWIGKGTNRTLVGAETVRTTGCEERQTQRGYRREPSRTANLTC